MGHGMRLSTWDINPVRGANRETLEGSGDFQGGGIKMNTDQKKVQWQGEVISVQPRSNVWRYVLQNWTI